MHLKCWQNEESFHMAVAREIAARCSQMHSPMHAVTECATIELRLTSM